MVSFKGETAHLVHFKGNNMNEPDFVCLIGLKAKVEK